MQRYNSINEATVDQLSKLLVHGDILESRAGDTCERLYVDFLIKHPRNRHLALHGRTNNFFATCAELVWVLAGKDEIDPVLSFFLPRAKEYSDDGKTWTNAYGKKLFLESQFDALIDELWDSPQSRRGVMSIWNPYDDNLAALYKKGIAPAKDVSCSTFIGVIIRNKELHFKIQMRSNDALFGMSHINIFEWTVLQEIIMEFLKKKHDGLKLGDFRYSVQSLHVYTSYLNQVRDILMERQPKSENKIPIQLPDTVLPNGTHLFQSFGATALLKNFFGEIYEIYVDAISKLTPENWDVEHHVFEARLVGVFSRNRCPSTDNILWFYAYIPLLWIYHKKVGSLALGGPVEEHIAREIRRFPDDIRQACQFSNKKIFMTESKD